jgi:hypothetical protein
MSQPLARSMALSCSRIECQSVALYVADCDHFEFVHLAEPAELLHDRVKQARSKLIENSLEVAELQ